MKNDNALKTDENRRGDDNEWWIFCNIGREYGREEMKTVKWRADTINVKAEKKIMKLITLLMTVLMKK